MLKELDDGDWSEAFDFAGAKEGCGNNAGGSKVGRALPNDADTNLDPFCREDVKRIIAMVEGKHDEQDWLICGELNDGRFFALSAGCDYTGWD